MARMTLTDFDQELIARGFDSFSPETRARYINWGYMRIARRARWLWEQHNVQVNLVAGDIGIGAWSDPSDAQHPIGNLKSINKVYVTAPADGRAKLEPISDDEFFEHWFVLDLTNAQNQGKPSGYYWYDEKLYVLPPPDNATTVVVHYKRQVTPMLSGEYPITPPDLDEAILTAALVRAHKRASELTLSQTNAMELEEVFSDMATDETFLEEEQPSRVSPDDSWL